MIAIVGEKRQREFGEELASSAPKEAKTHPYGIVCTMYIVLLLLSFKIFLDCEKYVRSGADRQRRALPTIDRSKRSTYSYTYDRSIDRSANGSIMDGSKM